MKKTIMIPMVCLLLAGCGSTVQPPETTAETVPILQMGNPWKDYASLEEAEAVCGLDFPLENVVAASHVSALSHETNYNGSLICAESIIRAARGEKPLYPLW